MDRFSILSALTAWKNEFSQPPVLMDDDLRALYQFKRALERAKPRPLPGPIRREVAEAAEHSCEAIRLAFRRVATNQENAR